jgi:hypothetical protein
VSSRRTGGDRTRRAVGVTLAVLAVALIGLGGSLLPAQQASYRQSPVPAVGRTSTVCATAPADGATASIAAVAVRQAPGRAGLLRGTAGDGDRAIVELTEQGRGVLVPAPADPVVLRGEGVMATAASASTFSTATAGELAGLMAAGCAAPASNHWFPGVGARDEFRTDLLLTNPDEGEARVDLRFYGPDGLVVVPGSPGLVIPGGTSRTVALASLVQVDGPLSVWVRASEGRVSATALNRVSNELDPVGADLQAGSAPPGTTQVIAGVPGGDGTRTLVVANPGSSRATVGVAVLGLEGSYAPVGAESLVVQPESTATVELAAGLVGQSGSVALSSDQPVAAAVVSRSSRSGAQPDLATQAAGSPIIRTGVVPLATVDQLDTAVTLSNGGDALTPVTIEVLSYAGVRLRSEEVLLVPHGTAVRRLTSTSSPSYLVVSTPAGSQVYGGLSYAQPDGNVAGLATVAVASPDVAARAPQSRFDPGLAR